MSLFKVREFWSTTSEDDEYFDQNSLIVTKLNSDSDFILTGSQSGVLRIFKPSCEIKEDCLSGFSANDLIVEKIFDNPILQIGCGKFVLASPMLQLAILHPMLLSIYNLVTKEGIAEHGTQHILELVYQHKLPRSAANFAIGAFGGSQNRDFICVQSLDGMLMFFEQETQTFNCLLPDFLLPSPISYVKKTDSFVTCSPDWCIVSYRYKALSESGEGVGEKIYSTPKLTPDWSYNLGESIIDINVINDVVNKEVWIAILGERNLFCINEGGKTKFMKRLEYSPVCFTCYILEDKLFSLVVSETNTLLIYQNTTLKWSANLHFLPVCIRRCFLKNVKGALVLISEEGRLECSYLGTEPCLFVAPPLSAKEIDFDKAEQELVELNRIIKNAYGSDMKVESSSAEKDLQINIKVLQELETCTIEDNIKEAFNNQMCTVLIELVPQVPFEEVQVSVFVQKPLRIVPNSQFYSNLKEKTALTCHAFLDYEMEVPSLTAGAVVSVITALGVPRTLTKYAALPLGLVMEPCGPPKEQGEQKITININRAPPSLAAVFPEFVNEDTFTHSTSSVTFKNVTDKGHLVTLLPAKSSERYRLQSVSLSSISLLAEQLIYRLKEHFQTDEEFKIFFGPGSLPSSGICQCVRKHFEARQTVVRLQNDLFQLSSQFRVIQKRLIAKLKMKNPTPLTNIELLMEDTYSQINSITDELENELENLSRTQTELACCLNLIWNLIKIMDIDENLKKTLESLFCVNVQDLETQSWENVMDGSLCYLLRTKLAKSEKDRLRTSHTSFEEIKDVSKLEKHLTQVLERISKSGSSANQAKDEILNNNETEERENEEKEIAIIKPIGTQIAESSSRLLSARKGLLRRRKKDEDVQDK